MSIEKTMVRRPLRWAVPLGAVAAAVIVWVGIHERDMKRSREDAAVQIARSQRAPLVPPAGATPAPESRVEESKGRPEERVSTSRPDATPVVEEAPPPQEGTANDDFAKKKSVEGVLSAGNVSQPSAPSLRAGPMKKSSPSSFAARSSSGGVAATRTQDDKQQLKQVPAPQSSQSIAAEIQQQAPPQSQATEAVTVQTPPNPQAPQTEVADLQQKTQSAKSSAFTRKMAEQANLLDTAARDRRYVVAPGEQQAWRVGDQGTIYRTSNLGKSWKAQNSGVTTDLISGSAPSADVCWLIGKAGTILLTTDGGKHWKQIPSPINGDLGGVRATDALRASVWDAASRKSFETNDGGTTWTQTQ